MINSESNWPAVRNHLVPASDTYGQMLQKLPTYHPCEFTTRQRHIMYLLTRDFREKSMSGLLRVASSTVATFRSDALDRIPRIEQKGNRLISGLAYIALDSGIVPFEPRKARFEASPITDIEGVILRGISLGYNGKAIAEKVPYAYGAIKAYSLALREKFDVTTHSGAVRRAFELGLYEPTIAYEGDAAEYSLETLYRPLHLTNTVAAAIDAIHV